MRYCRMELPTVVGVGRENMSIVEGNTSRTNTYTVVGNEGNNVGRLCRQQTQSGCASRIQARKSPTRM